MDNKKASDQGDATDGETPVFSQYPVVAGFPFPVWNMNRLLKLFQFVFSLMKALFPSPNIVSRNVLRYASQVFVNLTQAKVTWEAVWIF